MRLVLYIAISLVLLGGAAAAQTEEIGLFVDTNYEECKLVDTSPGIVSVYVVHNSGGGSMASQFKLQTGTGVYLSYLGEVSSFATTIGNTQSGISVGYGACKFSEFLVATINYYASGNSGKCASIWVVPDPASPTGTIEVVNCSASLLQGSGSRLVINSDGSCDCGPTTSDTNWGKIKNIYD
jgi:hypothetical protein